MVKLGGGSFKSTHFRKNQNILEKEGTKIRTPNLPLLLALHLVLEKIIYI